MYLLMSIYCSPKYFVSFNETQLIGVFFNNTLALNDSTVVRLISLSCFRGRRKNPVSRPHPFVLF